MQLIQQFKQIITFIEDKFGLWAEIITRHIFRSAPTLILPPLIQILDAISTLDDPQQRQQHIIPSPLIKYIAYAHNTLICLFRAHFTADLILPLTYYTTIPRWPYTVPPVLHKIRNTLITFYTSIPQTLRRQHTGLESPLLDEIISYYQRVIRHEADILETYAYKQSLANIPEETPDTLNRLDQDISTHHRSIPQDLQHTLYVPFAQQRNIPTTADTLFHALYNSTTDRNLVHFNQFTYLTNTAYHRSDHSSTQQSQQLSLPPSPETDNLDSPERAEPPLHRDSPIFYEARESPTPAVNIASRPIIRNPRDDTPPTHPHIEGNASNTIRPPMTTNNPNPSELHDNIAKAIETSIQQLWHRQIEPQLNRRNDEARQFMDDVQQQMSIMRQSLDEPTTHICPTTPFNDNDHNPRHSGSSNQTQHFHYPRVIEPPPATSSNAETLYDTRDNNRDARQEPPATTTAIATTNQNQTTAIVPYKTKRPVDIDKYITGMDNPILTEDDMERFSRKPLDHLTDAHVRAFAEQLEQHLTANPNDLEHNAEGTALRKLIHQTPIRFLGPWLQIYLNPGIQFTYPKTQYWRKKFEENIHYCMPKQAKKPEMTDCFEQLTRIIEERLPLPDNNNQRNNQNQRNFFNNNSNQQRNYNNNNYNNHNNYNQNQNNYQNRNDYQNRNNYNRNNQQYSNNNNNYYNNNNNFQSSYNNNNHPNNYPNPQRNNYDNRNNQPPPQQQRPNNYDNRNNQYRNNDQRQQNQDRRNQNYNTNNMDDIEQDFYNITTQDDFPSFDDMPNLQQDNDIQEQQDFQ